MRVLALASYPVEAAATRFRLSQFVGPLKALGICLEIRPFLDSAGFRRLYGGGSRLRVGVGIGRSVLQRIRDVATARGFDAILVQREAMLLGPPVVEYALTQLRGLPMVLDLDDATYVRYQSPTHGRLASALKCFGKTDDLIRRAKVVTCGSRAIVEHVAAAGVPAVALPTVADTEVFRPRDDSDWNDPPVVGWVGTHSTYRFLASIFPALGRLASTRRFRLKVVGSGRDCVEVPGVAAEALPWELGREVEDFRSIDVGVYPLVDEAWSRGKSGFKAIQYMAVGVPFVTTPVGVCESIGEPGVTHLTAATADEWHDALAGLLDDPESARRMGAAGRRHVLAHYNVPAQAEILAGALRFAASWGDLTQAGGLSRTSSPDAGSPP